MLAAPESYFSETYLEARSRFVEAIRDAKGEISSTTNPHARGPADEALITDVAWFGPKTASRVMLSISGTHGQEFFAGAAGQRAWLVSGEYGNLPTDVAVCLVHANNAFGAAHFSRSNENNVDLNRNYFDHSQSRKTDSLYGDLHDTIFPRRNAGTLFEDGTARFVEWCKAHTTEQLVSALDVGQQSHPDGIIYCGQQEEWSTRNLRRIADSYLRQAEKIALIDWHTGLVKFGEATGINVMDQTSDQYRWACAWWGRPGEPVKQSQIKGPSPESVGYIHAGMAADLRRHGSTVADAVIEWGTFDNPSVIAALLIDRWLRFECTDPQSAEAVMWRTRMMERLNPTLHDWRKAVVDGSVSIYANTIRGLAFWS